MNLSNWQLNQNIGHIGCAILAYQLNDKVVDCSFDSVLVHWVGWINERVDASCLIDKVLVLDSTNAGNSLTLDSKEVLRFGLLHNILSLHLVVLALKVVVLHVVVAFETWLPQLVITVGIRTFVLERANSSTFKVVTLGSFEVFAWVLPAIAGIASLATSGR